MKRLKDNRGFTLIELLVVVAIIGLLAAIILSSLQSAKKKGTDSRVISDVREARTAIQTGYNGYAYSDLNYSSLANCANTASITSGVATNANCTLSTGPDNVSLNAVVSDVIKQGSSIYFLVNSDLKSYAIRVSLASNPNVYYCLDSSGIANQADNNTVSIAGNATINAACH